MVEDAVNYKVGGSGAGVTVGKHQAGYGCSCSFMVCGCAYPPTMLKIFIGISILLFIATALVVLNENYCSYNDVVECQQAHMNFCETRAGAEGLADDNTKKLLTSSCICRYCEKCINKASKNASAQEQLCRMVKTGKDTNNDTVTRKVTELAIKIMERYGISPTLYGFS